MSQPTLTPRCWLSIADLGDIDFTSFISRCWLSEDGLLFHLAIGMKSTGGQPLASTRCGQQFVVGQAAADIPDTKKCYQCYLSAAAYAPGGDADFETATANPPQGSSAAAEAGDAGARLPLEYSCGTVEGHGIKTEPSSHLGHSRSIFDANDGEAGHGAAANTGLDATREGQSEYQASPAGIPIHDEALALALDEGQNASNRWRLERHMSGQYSGTMLDEMSGLVARAERGELRR